MLSKCCRCSSTNWYHSFPLRRTVGVSLKVNIVRSEPVASLGLLSPWAATDGVTPIFSEKKLTSFLVIAVCKVMTVFLTRLSTVLSKFSHIFFISFGCCPERSPLRLPHPLLVTPLIRAIEYRADSAGCRDKAGATVCHLLARYGHTEALRWLIESTGAECLTARTLRGATPLHYAATTGHLDTLRYVQYFHTWISTNFSHLTQSSSSPGHDQTYHPTLVCLQVIT